MSITVRSGVCVDKRSSGGFIYARQAAEQAIAAFAGSLSEGVVPVLGSIFDTTRHRTYYPIAPDAIAHKVLGIKLDGDEIVADIEILDTPAGRYVRDCLDKGYRVVAKCIIAAYRPDQSAGQAGPMPDTIEQFSFRTVHLQITDPTP
jgi:hypothetical protein